MSQQRERILNEACELYLAEGLDGFSMRKLAKAVGVTAPALYKYYDSREAVLLDVLSQGYRLLARSLYDALGGTSAWERFRLAGRAHTEFALTHHRYYELIYTHPKHLGIDKLPPEIEAQGCAIHQFFMDRVRECMAAGLLRDGDPMETAITMWGHSHGLLSLYLGGMLTDEQGEPVDREGFMSVLSTSGANLMRGLATPERAEEVAADLLCGEMPDKAGAMRDGTGRSEGSTSSPDNDNRVVA